MSTVSNDRKKSIVKADCAECRGVRNCKIKGRFSQRGGDDDFMWHTDWYILQCRGCEAVFCRMVSTNSEDYKNYYEEDGSTGTTYNETINYWPALAKRSFPEWMSVVGIDANGVEKLDEALIELYKALNSDLYILAAIGIRMSFDVASNLLGIDESMPFRDKINELELIGKIGPQDRVRLSSLVEAGNASAHRGWKPSADDLNAMMDALEYFIHEAFVVPARKAKTDARLAAMDKVVPRKVRRPARGSL